MPLLVKWRPRIRLLVYEYHKNGQAWWRGLTEEEREALLLTFSKQNPTLVIRNGERATYYGGKRVSDGVYVPKEAKK